MPEIRFEELPPANRKPGNGQTGDSFRIATALRGRPKEWAVIKTYEPKQHSTARGYVARVNGGKTAAYGPAGHFEAAARTVDGEIRVYARYVGEAGESRD